MSKLTIKTLALAVASLMFSTAGQADTILGLYVGADAWSTSTSGAFTSEFSDSSKTFDDDTTNNIYIALEHPLPMVPNLMLRRTSVDLKGDSFTGNFFFNGNNNTYSAIELNQTDAILYYEILDNGLASFDVGVNLRKADGDYKVMSSTDDSLIESTSFSGYIPMLYAAGELGILTTGFSVYGDYNAISVGDHSMSDFQAGVAYQFVDNLAIDVSARLGYRKIKVELDDLDGISSNLNVDGITAGIRVHF